MGTKSGSRPHFGPVWEKTTKSRRPLAHFDEKGGPRGAQGRRSRSHGRVNKKKREKVLDLSEKVWESEKNRNPQKINKKVRKKKIHKLN